MSPAEAEAGYRDAWRAYLLTSDPDVKRSLEETMDRLQPFIADRATDLAWKRFAASLPGYLKFWGAFKRRIVP